MPKVTPRRQPKTKKKARRSAKRRPARSSRGARSEPSLGAAIARTRAMVEEYAFASIAGALVLLALVVGVFWAGGYAGRLANGVDDAGRSLARAAGFKVKRITLRGGHDVSHAEVFAAIGPMLDTSLLHVDLERARADIEGLGWVRRAAVARLLPNTLHITIDERAPGAVWQEGGKVRLIDHSGEVIREIATHEYAHLPMIVGVGAPQAAAALLGALEARPGLATATSALIRVGERRWNLRLRNGVDILLPEEDEVSAVDLLWRMHEAQGVLDQPLEYIDLRDGERVVVRRRIEAAAGDASN
ncbi:MAG: cell division protein FtsQ/DivIB [Pseudomonadota bacterium]